MQGFYAFSAASGADTVKVNFQRQRRRPIRRHRLRRMVRPHSSGRSRRSHRNQRHAGQRNHYALFPRRTAHRLRRRLRQQLVGQFPLDITFNPRGRSLRPGRSTQLDHQPYSLGVYDQLRRVGRGRRGVWKFRHGQRHAGISPSRSTQFPSLPRSPARAARRSRWARPARSRLRRQELLHLPSLNRARCQSP